MLSTAAGISSQRRARAGPAGSDSSSVSSSFASRSLSPATASAMPTSKARFWRCGSSAGVRRSACSPSSAAACQAPRACAARAADAIVPARAESGESAARARCLARSSSSSITRESSKCNSRRAAGRDRFFAAAAIRGWAARTRCPSTTRTFASRASSSVAGSTIDCSCETVGSWLSATASNNRRTPAGSRSTLVPSRSSTVSGTGRSSPSPGRSPSASVRPTSSANRGLPIVRSTTRRSS